MLWDTDPLEESICKRLIGSRISPSLACLVSDIAGLSCVDETVAADATAAAAVVVVPLAPGTMPVLCHSSSSMARCSDVPRASLLRKACKVLTSSSS